MHLLFVLLLSNFALTEHLSGDGGELPVFELNSTHINFMAENVNILYEGNYTFEEVAVIDGQDEIRFSLTTFLDGQWEVSSSFYYIVDSQVLPDLNAIDSYLASQNLTPVNLSAHFLAQVSAPNGTANIQFGGSVSQAGNILAVGASWATGGVGAAYLYRTEQNGTATYLSKVTAPDAAANDFLGSSISQSGNLLAVGAFGSDLGGFSDAGAVYLYRVEQNGSTTYLSKVIAPDGGPMDYFGKSVSQSGDILAVGAHTSDPGGITDSGSAYLYRVEQNGTATFLDKVYAPDRGASDLFGASLSLSGNLLAVGSHKSDPGGVSAAGAAYLYKLEQNGSATYLTKVTAPDATSEDQFGISVSQSGNILAVGAQYADSGGDSGVLADKGAVYTYRLEENGTATFLWKNNHGGGAANDHFGGSVSLSANLLVVGAKSADPGNVANAGAAYLYRLEDNGSFTYLERIVAPNGEGSDNFGFSISHSGDFLAVSAIGADSTYLFDVSDYATVDGNFTESGDGNYTDTGDGNYTDPGDGNFTDPGDGNFTDPGDGNFTDPGDGNFTDPGDGNFTDPGDGNFTDPGDGNFTDPGDGNFTDPGDGNFTDPGDGNFTDPGDGNFTDPGDGNFTGPGDGNFTDPGDGNFRPRRW